MTHEEFTSQVKRLIEVFGIKNFPDERIKTLWDRVRHEGFNEFQKATDKIILERYAPPPASVILEAINDFKVGVKNPTKQEIPFDCSWCGQSGFVTARVNENPSECVAFRCACEWFSYKAKGNFMTWSNSLKSRFYPEFYKFQEWTERPERMDHFKDETGETQRQLARKYGEEIKTILKGIGSKLPYDPTERINIEEFIF